MRWVREAEVKYRQIGIGKSIYSRTTCVRKTFTDHLFSSAQAGQSNSECGANKLLEIYRAREDTEHIVKLHVFALNPHGWLQLIMDLFICNYLNNNGPLNI